MRGKFEGSLSPSPISSLSVSLSLSLSLSHSLVQLTKDSLYLGLESLITSWSGFPASYSRTLALVRFGWRAGVGLVPLPIGDWEWRETDEGWPMQCFIVRVRRL